MPPLHSRYWADHTTESIGHGPCRSLASQRVMIDGRRNIDPAVFQLHGTDIAAMLHAHEHLTAAKVDRARRQHRTEADAARARHAPRHAGMRIERSTSQTIGHDAGGRVQRRGVAITVRVDDAVLADGR